MSRPPKLDREESVRKERVPVASQRAPLRYKGLDHKTYYYRWVIDKDDRIQMFLDAGYDFTPATSQGYRAGDPTVDSAQEHDSRVVKAARGGPLKLYLMQLDWKYYNEDQAKKQKEVDLTEESMQRPGTGKAVPKTGIDYGTINLNRTNILPKVEDD